MALLLAFMAARRPRWRRKSRQTSLPPSPRLRQRLRHAALEAPRNILPKQEQDGEGAPTFPAETPYLSSSATPSPQPETASPTPAPSAPPTSPAASLAPATPSPSLAPSTPQPTAQEIPVSITAVSAQYTCVYGESFSFGARDLLVNGMPMEAWANETDTANRARFVNALLAGIAYDGSLSTPILPGVYSIAAPACKAGGYASASVPVATLSIERKPVSLLVQGNWRLRFTGKALSIPTNACTFASGNSTPLKDAEIALLLDACRFSVAEGKTLKDAGKYTIHVSLEESAAQLYALSANTLTLTIQKAAAPLLPSQEIAPLAGRETEYQLDLAALLPAGCGAILRRFGGKQRWPNGVFLRRGNRAFAHIACCPKRRARRLLHCESPWRIMRTPPCASTFCPSRASRAASMAYGSKPWPWGAISEYLFQNDAVKRAICAAIAPADDANATGDSVERP